MCVCGIEKLTNVQLNADNVRNLNAVRLVCQSIWGWVPLKGAFHNVSIIELKFGTHLTLYY